MDGMIAKAGCLDLVRSPEGATESGVHPRSVGEERVCFSLGLPSLGAGPALLMASSRGP